MHCAMTRTELSQQVREFHVTTNSVSATNLPITMRHFELRNMEWYSSCFLPLWCHSLTQILSIETILTSSLIISDIYIYKRAKKNCRRAAECGRPLSAANRRLPTPSGNGGERQTPVIFTPRAVLDPMLQTVMDPGISLPVIPLHESQVTAARLTGVNPFRSLHMYALCTLYTGRIK